MSVAIGTLGIWSGEVRFKRDRGEALAAAAEIDELGFGALWLPGGAQTAQGSPFDVLAEILDATPRMALATGILSIWTVSAPDAAAGQVRLRDAHPGRFLLGLGVSHEKLVEEHVKPMLSKPRTAMAAYLEQLDRALEGKLVDERVLAALGPRMLELARDHAAGSHPYLVTPEHTAAAREILGPEPLLAPEQAVVLEREPSAARAIGRAHLEAYLGLPNYTNNLLRHGFEEHDLLDGGSDRLVDALVAWGDEDDVAARVARHREAGADHVALQVLTGRPREMPLPEWRRLAALIERAALS